MSKSKVKIKTNRPHPDSYRPDIPLVGRYPSASRRMYNRWYGWDLSDKHHRHVMAETKKELARIERERRKRASEGGSCWRSV